MDAEGKRWELRQARVHGSRHVAFYDTRATAEAEANRVIAATGGVGRIEYVSVQDRIVYFDQYREDS